MENQNKFAKYYLVDYDSVKQNGIEGIENLTVCEKVLIFYTEGNNNIEMSFFEKVHASSAEIKLRKISGGDSFTCIVSACAGYIIGTDESAEICIVSKNSEYKSLENFWTSHFNISIQENISGKVSEKTEKPNNNNNNNNRKSFFGFNNMDDILKGINIP